MENFSKLFPIALLALSLEALAGSDPPPQSYMTGLYWMSGSAKGLGYNEKEFTSYARRYEEALRDNNLLSGVVIHVHWNHIEPEEGRWHFEKLDRLVELARQYRKSYKFIIVPGVATPRFVYENGAQPFDSGMNGGIRIPVPFDPVYQKCFYRLVETLASRYQSDPWFIAVALTCANSMGGELHLPKLPADMKKWEQHGDFKAKIELVLQDGLDRFAAAFPRQQLCLHLSPPLGGMEEHVKRVIEHGVQKYAERFTLQSCQLNGRTDNLEHGPWSYKVIMEYKDKLHNGFQNVSGWKEDPERQGSMEMTTYNLVRTDTEYWELWQGDGRSIKTCTDLLRIWDEAKRLGSDRYREKLIRENNFSFTKEGKASKT